MKLEITEPAQKDLAEMDAKTQERIKNVLDRFLSHPQTVDLKKLKGSSDMWRLRVGEWRIILRFDRKQEVLYVLRIRHRREAYRG